MREISIATSSEYPLSGEVLPGISCVLLALLLLFLTLQAWFCQALGDRPEADLRVPDDLDWCQGFRQEGHARLGLGFHSKVTLQNKSSALWRKHAVACAPSEYARRGLRMKSRPLKEFIAEISGIASGEFALEQQLEKAFPLTCGRGLICPHTARKGPLRIRALKCLSYKRPEFTGYLSDIWIQQQRLRSLPRAKSTFAASVLPVEVIAAWEDMPLPVQNHRNQRDSTLSPSCDTNVEGLKDVACCEVLRSFRGRVGGFSQGRREIGQFEVTTRRSHLAPGAVDSGRCGRHHHSARGVSGNNSCYAEAKTFLPTQLWESGSTGDPECY